ncbi:hypothetical protein [Mammaliicoccus sciuri]
MHSGSDKFSVFPTLIKFIIFK